MSCGLSDDFAARFAYCVRRRFRSKQTISREMSVHWNTADLWWQGLAEPRGRHLARYMRMYPDDIPFLLGD